MRSSDQSASHLPEKTLYSKYYEHDGALRAYANRSMVLALLFGAIALLSLGFAIYVRLQPPTVVRVAANGEATVVGGGVKASSPTRGLLNMLSGAANSETAPADIEGRAVVRRFLEHYLAYTPSSVDQQFADALNMMTANLRQHVLNRLREEDIIGKIRDEQITSTFKLRSNEPVANQPWTYVAFGVKEVHRIRNKSEFTDRIVSRYLVRLIQERRSERVPSGLLVAEFGESQMVGEKDTGLDQSSLLIGE